MKNFVQIMSLMAIFCVLTGNGFAAEYRFPKFKCSGQTDDGKSFSITSAMNALESNPPLDAVRFAIEGVEHGGYGKHGFAYAPGLRVLRESLTSTDRILISIPDAEGKVDIEFQLTGKYGFPKSLRASGISCEELVVQDFGSLDSLTLKKDKPFETLAQDAMEGGRESKLADAYSILSNLMEPSADVIQAYRGLFLNNPLNLKERFESPWSSWGKLFSLMLSTESLSPSEKASLVREFYRSHPEAGAGIALATFRGWSGITQNFQLSRDLFLELSPRLDVILADKNVMKHVAVSEWIVPNLFGTLPERLHALDLLFSTVEVDNNLAAMLHPIYKDLSPDEFSDFMKNVAPRLLRAPTFGPETVQTLQGLAEEQKDPEQREAILKLLRSVRWRSVTRVR